ncbi:MAG: response regulator [Cyanobacteria bacterium P01_F01_bin.86]
MSEQPDCENTILVVDDTPANLEVLVELLSLAGYTVLTAISGKRALKLLQTNRPALILLDVQMPHMDGFETCQQIKANVETAHIPVIFLTVFLETEKITAGFSLGAVDYITKPFREAELLARVRTHLQLHCLTQNLEQSEKRLRRAIENAPFPIMIHAEDGEVLQINSTWTELTGYSHVDIPTTTAWAQRAYGEEAARVLKDTIAQKYTLTSRWEEGEFIINTHNGEQCLWQFSSAPLGALPDGRRMVISMAVDVTQRRQVEAERETLLHNLSDLNQELERANQQLTDYSQTLEKRVVERTQDLSQTLEHLKATQDELIQSEKMAALGQLIAGVAHELNTPLGIIRSSTGNLNQFMATQLQALLPFLQSIPPEQQQDFLALLQHNNAEMALLSTREQRQRKRNLTHQLVNYGIEPAVDFAQLLMGIGLYDNLEPFLPLLRTPNAQSMLEMAYEWCNVRVSTRNIATAADRAAKVVFALKTYARYDSTGEKTPAQITEGIDTVLTLYHNQLKQGVEVIRHYAKSLPMIWCYPDELNQVWINLIHNSIQAMANQGTLTINVSQHQATIQVDVIDTGPGISPDNMSHIFQPFFTTKPPGEGSGLGLDIVKKIIAKHQGEITVTSEPGHTCFTVLLPIESA